MPRQRQGAEERRGKGCPKRWARGRPLVHSSTGGAQAKERPPASMLRNTAAARARSAFQRRRRSR
eukprot:15484709-Alexandrium_andersonii.AAC.1